jgi:Concanavalin A-like lectin/glucanases superfamily
MPFIQPLGQLRASVETYAQLPVTENVLGDMRILSDLGTLWVWMNVSSSGSLSDWQKITISTYQDLQGRPSTSPLAIDDAMLSVRNIYLNYVYLFFMNIVSISSTIMKMFEGTLDALLNEDAIDLTRTSGQRHILVPTMRNYVGYYVNNFDGSLDQYTKALIQGRNLDGTDFFDAMLNDIKSVNVVSDEDVTKFGIKSLSFDGNNYLVLTQVNTNDSPFHVAGLDFTWDFWVRCNADTAETIIVDHAFNHEDGTNFKIEKLANKTIRVFMRGCTDYDWDMQNYPHDPVSYEVTGTIPVEKNIWYHIGVERQSGYIKLYINGILDGTSSVSDNQDIIDYLNEVFVMSEQGFRIGQGFNGRMEEIRFSKGVARYTTNFIPRTSPYNTPTQFAPCNNMVIQSEGYEANAIPTSARIVVFEQNGISSFNPTVIEDVIPNTDIKVYVSRDGGTTFTQATDLKIEFDIMQEILWTSIYRNVNFIIGTVDLQSQPNGKEMVYKITTHNNKDLLIRSVALNWK